MYSRVGWGSVLPEGMLTASPLISLYSVRGERAFCEELENSLLFRRFLGMSLMEHSFDPTRTFIESACGTRRITAERTLSRPPGPQPASRLTKYVTGRSNQLTGLGTSLFRSQLAALLPTALGTV